MVSIHLEGVTVDFPVATLRARSLRTEWMSRLKRPLLAQSSRLSTGAARVGGAILARGEALESVRALDGVTLDLKEGDRLGLIGPNGSGKTTLIRLLAGIYEPSNGIMRVTGHCVPMFDISIGFEGESTGLENIHTRGLMMGLTEREIQERTEEIVEFSELGDYIHMPIRTYSSGMLLRLMFSIATSVRGDIVLMDEWIAVGDEHFRDKANERLFDLTAKAGILVIASHDPGILLKLCNLGMRLESGKVRDFGPIEEVLHGKPAAE